MRDRDRLSIFYPITGVDKKQTMQTKQTTWLNMISMLHAELNFRLRFLKFPSRLEMPRLFGSRFQFSVMKNSTFSYQFSSVFNISKIFQDLESFD